jgi:RNA polymerase sigma-70 factor (ECF subfamily)
MNEKDAEDIVHNAFTKLWQKKSLLLENTNIEAWLYKVTRNEALSMIDHRRVVDKHRKDYERKMLDINSGALRSFELPQDTVFDISDIIEQLLASMSPQCRKVFIYSRTMSYKEIAEKMSISVKTVESHMSKALVIFRKGLSDYFLIFFILFLI